MEWSQVGFRKRRSSGNKDIASINLKSAYSAKIAIPENKLRDLTSLLRDKQIKTFYKPFYDSLV